MLEYITDQEKDTVTIVSVVDSDGNTIDVDNNYYFYTASKDKPNDQLTVTIHDESLEEVSYQLNIQTIHETYNPYDLLDRYKSQDSSLFHHQLESDLIKTIGFNGTQNIILTNNEIMIDTSSLINAQTYEIETENQTENLTISPNENNTFSSELVTQNNQSEPMLSNDTVINNWKTITESLMRTYNTTINNEQTYHAYYKPNIGIEYKPNAMITKKLVLNSNGNPIIISKNDTIIEIDAQTKEITEHTNTINFDSKRNSTKMILSIQNTSLILTIY